MYPSIKDGLSVAPTRLTVAAADALLSITYAIALDCPSTEQHDFENNPHVKALGNSLEDLRGLIVNLIKVDNVYICY
jgi:hypothetical protein